MVEPKNIDMPLPDAQVAGIPWYFVVKKGKPTVDIFTKDDVKVATAMSANHAFLIVNAVNVLFAMESVTDHTTGILKDLAPDDADAQN